MLRKRLHLIFTMIFTFGIILAPKASFAAGVPQYQYTSPNSNFLYSGDPTEYWFNHNPVAGVLPYLYDSGKYYSGVITVNLKTGGYDYLGLSSSGWSVALVVQGTSDGNAWVDIGSWSNFYSDGNPTVSRQFDCGSAIYKQIRIFVRDNPPSHIFASGSFNAQVFAVVADQETAQQAATAAQQARDAANNTVQYAQQAANAANNVNTIVNSTLTVNAGVVQDSSGTVLTAARAARDAAQQASSKLDNVQNAINKVQNTITNINQYLPPTLNKISGLNGASATSSGVLQVVIDASNATQYSYRIDSGGWSPWMPIQDTVSIPVPKGVHTLTIQVANGPVGTPGPAAKSSMQVIGL